MKKILKSNEKIKMTKLDFLEPQHFSLTKKKLLKKRNGELTILIMTVSNNSLGSD